MNDTTNRQAIQREETTSNTVNAADLDTSNASTSAAACSNQNQAVLSSSSTATSTSTSIQQNLVDEEEQVVTSTSNENSGNTPQHPTSDFPDITLQRFITSPARITSSTGNDYSSSPTEPPQTREETQNLLLSSEDDSSEQQQLATATTLRKAREFQKHRISQQGESNNFNVAMPTTSSAAAASSAIVSSDETQCNHLAASTSRLDTIVERRGVICSDRNNGNLARNISTENLAVEPTTPNMVARDSGNNLASKGTGTGTGSAASEPSENHVEKIILKLPKTNLPPNNNESQHSQYHTRHHHQQQQQRREQKHLLEDDPSMSNSCSNSSTNSSITAEADTRKVEPLKINLHHGSHQHHNPSSSGSSSSNADSPHIVPKITIKPLFKKSAEGFAEHMQNSESNATDAQSKQADPIPKLTIKATGNSCSIGESTITEPHIVPKLTIRAAHEERGCTHTSVVPKLTIKISDTQSQHGLLHNSLHSPPPNVKSLGSAQAEQSQQPPLPKLTIKTTLDGASGSSIMSSSISPALSSSNSSSSAASSPQSSLTALVTAGTSAAVGSTPSVPKITIKTMSKSVEETQPVVPKLTIKTSASGSCVTTTTEAPIMEVSADAGIPGGSSSSTSSLGIKIPKMTIKTGQEHAVIITQHSNDQIIPKLTIKTKSKDLDESQCEINKDPPPPPEKIPKLTIKTPLSEVVPPIPKLTISTPHSPKSHSASLVVRQVAAATSPTSSRKTQSPDRLPKLMISRQDMTVNYSTESQTEKTVPKLTIKTAPTMGHEQDEEVNEKQTKIPKLTIKTLPPPPKDTVPSSEDSEDGTSEESGPSTIENELQRSTANKIVPKLTITNLGSPKLKLKTTMVSGEKSSIEKLPSTTIEHKKSLKSNAQIHSMDQKGQQPKNTENMSRSNVVVNGGESSSSQEFCGFTENTSDSPLIAAESQQLSTNRKGQLGTKVTKANEELAEDRRSSDDMDIDEGLQEHDPKIFKNLTHFSAIHNGEDYGIHMEKLPQMGQMGTNKSPQSMGLPSTIVDTVDLTSSPSPGSSPAHFNYTDADPKVPEFMNATSQSNANALLLECLKRENSVIQTAAPRMQINDDIRMHGFIGSKEKSNSLLLSQLTAPLRYPPPPPLQPRPPTNSFNPTHQTGMKYAQFADGLIANGAHPGLQQQQSATASQQANLSLFPAAPLGAPMNLSHQFHSSAKPSTVIDSIEILDTPDGSPRSSQDDSQSVGEFPNHLQNAMQHVFMGHGAGAGAGNGGAEGLLRHNNNTMHQHMSDSLDINHSALLKRSAKQLAALTNDSMGCGVVSPPNKMRRTENLAPTMATLTILTSDKATNSATLITTSPTIIGGTDNNCTQTSPKTQTEKCPSNTSSAAAAAATSPPVQQGTPHHHRSRKQKLETLLDVTMDDINQLDVGGSKAPPSKQNINCIKPPGGSASAPAPLVNPAGVITPVPRKRGRPRRIRPEEQQPTQVPTQTTRTVSTLSSSPNLSNCSTAERRVQLLRKRLAIDMVSAEQPVASLAEKLDNTEIASPLEDGNNVRRERTVRTTRRCGTPNPMNAEKQVVSAIKQRRQRIGNMSGPPTNFEIATTSTTASTFNHFGGSNSSISSACSSNSSYATTMTTATSSATAFMGPSNHPLSLGPVQINCSFSTMSSQIDLTMSSSSSTCSGSTTATLTTVEAGGRSMLPPIKALSSTDPLPDVVFQSKDFSAIMMTQQLSSPSSRQGSRANSQDGDDIGGSIGSGSGDDANSLTSPIRTPGRGRGRGRGRGSRGGGPRSHRLGRGASAVAKAIALNRPRCVGGLKHTPDPERMKGIFTTSPQVFEEDTCMSADMNQTLISSELQTPTRQPDFFANEEESQSSIISNTSTILDPNTVAAVQNGALVKRVKKKKMEVCAADETEFAVSAIAEYDWPPPKGCCPSKNRDTFMIQEQVANYLGIKSFKRKYPDLPRRQIDMEERNWLQEKGLVTEKMCDLGITAVWASDILDIMYADFYDKYEEYKDFVRKKHLREIEAKQKSLGINFGGRGLQARDRAMLSASKWNAYFNKTRKDERPRCMDLQNLMINVPLPTNVPATNLMNRSIADEIAKAANVERVAEPPTLLKTFASDRHFDRESFYPIAVVPGQYAAKYKCFSPLELSALPMNTPINDPLRMESGHTTTVDDTDSVSETCEANNFTFKRLKIRRSRRARTERSSKKKCDIKSETRPVSRQSESKRDEGANFMECSVSLRFSSSSSSSSSSCTDTSSPSESSSENETETEAKATAKCSVCQRMQNRNLRDVPELFINCYTCRRKVHPSCVEMPYRMTQRVRNYNWQCADCKCCIKCKRKQEPSKMLFCEQCDRGYHIYCLGLKSVPDVRWSCERCSVCLRCGATKPEGLPPPTQLSSQNGEKIKPIKHKKVKWINEYRIDHITKLREHCSMLCVPCGRSRPLAKRIQASMGNSNSRNTSASSGCSSSTTTTQQNSPQMNSQLSPGTTPSNSGTKTTTTSNIVSGTSVISNSTSNMQSIEATSPSPPPPPVVA